MTIKPVVHADIPVLLELIRELAVFEKLGHEMRATVPLLEEAFFAPNAAAGALLARENETVIGYAIFFFTFSSFTGRRGIWLDDVYVRPAFRQRGAGSALMRAVAEIGVKNNCARYEWSALNWNKNALAVYQKMGAKVMEEWLLLRVEGDGIRNLAFEYK